MCHLSESLLVVIKMDNAHTYAWLETGMEKLHIFKPILIWYGYAHVHTSTCTKIEINTYHFPKTYPYSLTNPPSHMYKLNSHHIEWCINKFIMHRVPSCDLDQLTQFGMTLQAVTSGHKEVLLLCQSSMDSYPNHGQCEMLKNRPFPMFWCNVMTWERGGGLYFTKISVAGFNTWKKLDTIEFNGFAKMSGQKDLKSTNKGVTWIENQGENWYKMLEIC